MGNETDIFTVKSVENPFDDYWVIEMTFDNEFNWEAGQHGRFELPDKDIEGKTFRIFSLASIKSEGKIIVGTRTGDEPSSFKQALINLNAGEKVHFKGPIGKFTERNDASPMVLFAAGVGVTPIRSMIKSLEDTDKQVEIVYAAYGDYLFKEDFDIFNQNDNASVHYTTEVEETQDTLKSLIKQYENNAYYYISGAPKVINSIKEFLQNNDVDKSRIISDPFVGY
ncbi:MAG: FAD-dependent oxidoreductase [Candidatus Izimaplasma sp.]|nr:FAD-dependent oxidoreductase [Candidatus Izimaplasma bacterium]